jgi:hypothetical protein
MKIAVCFSGQLRFVNEYSKYILEHLIKLYDADIYAHLWYDESMLGKPFHHEHSDLYKEKVEDFIHIYNPKKIITEKQIDFDLSQFNMVSREYELLHFSIETIKESIHRQISQWYSVKKTYELIENPHQYDFIIRLRTDSYLTKPIDLNLLRKDILYVQTGIIAGADRKYCDWFAIGNNNVMKYYMNLFEKSVEVFSNGLFHMHRFMEYAIVSSNIPSIDYEFGVPINHQNYKQKL